MIHRLAQWSTRNISIIGKTILINTFLISKIYFFATGSSLSPTFITCLKSISQQFLWESKHPPIKIQRCYGKRITRGIGLIDITSQSHKLFSKALIKILIANNSCPSWANAYKVNMTRAIGLNNPFSNHALSNYLATHKGTLGPHYLPKRWKNILWIMKHNDWDTSFIPTLNTKGYNPRQLCISIKGKQVSPTLPIQPPSTTQQIYMTPKLSNYLPNTISLHNPKICWDMCFIKSVPPKWQANT